MDNNKISRIKELVNQLNTASDAYYNTDKVLMTDQKFDKLFDELKSLEYETNYILSSSPTQKVGFEVKSKLEKITHSIPLKSLSKTKSIDEIKSFVGDKEVLAMLKGDGLTCEIIYENKQLIQGSTRGNSIIGESITHNVKTFKNVPLQINFDGYLKLAGESVIFDKDFQLINDKLKDEDKYSNSRNLVAGSVRQLNSKICANRNVNFMAFTLLECRYKNGEDIKFKTGEEQFNFLENLGFKIIPYLKIDKDNINYLGNNVEYLKKSAKDNGIPIDGIVFKYNDISYGKSLGETEHHPLNAIALKGLDDEYETKYIRTEWNVSRKGIINPIGIFEPVDLDGAITERATLHNIDYFEDLQLGENDIISVARQNMVIPKILDNKTRSNTETIPLICPVCGEKAEIRLQKTARFLYCTNDKCPAKKVAEFEHYCSRDAVNIMGISESIIEKLINKGLLKDIPDLYRLQEHKKEIVRLEGMGLKSYNNIIESIEVSRHCKLSNFLYSLGIPQTGKGTAKIFANGFKTIDNLISALDNNYNFMNLKDVGKITNIEVHEWWNKEETKELVNELLKYVIIEEDNKQVNQSTNSNIKDKVFVITGDVHIFKNRKELQEKIESLGAKVTSSVSAKTNYLLNNNVTSTSGKNKKAQELNIPIISEEDFMEMTK